jgi:pantoate--beta-alanine ligase
MSLPIAATVSQVREACDRARQAGQRVAFVPTMGALHQGHLALVREAQRRASFVVVSIFVNPTQFAPGEDFARYPRSLDDDVRKLAPLGDIHLFAPANDEIYPPGEQTRVRVGALAEPLCGRFRPGHFEGVATVVAKLFSVLGPGDALFGRKDYQQLLVVRRMARDLCFPVVVVDHPTQRDVDGLALSSRNAYLSPDERARARSMVVGLDAAARRFARGERGARELERAARAPLEAAGLFIEYVELRDAETLGETGPLMGDRGVLAVACRVGNTRLIDNLVLGQDAAPLAEPAP